MIKGGQTIRGVFALAAMGVGFLLGLALGKPRLSLFRKAATPATASIPLMRETVIESIKDGLVVLDNHSLVIDLNPAAERILGLSRDEMLSQPAELIFSRQTAVLNLYKSLMDQVNHPDTPDSLGHTASEIEMHITRLMGVDGVHAGYLVVLQDLVDWKQMRIVAERRLAELSSLREIDQRLNSTLELDEVLEIALDAVLEATGADAGFISLLESESSQRVMRVSGRYPRDLLGRLFPANIGVVGRAVRTRQALFVTDVQADSDYFPDLAETQAQMVIPLITHRKMIGIINLESFHRNAWSHKEFEFVQALAQRIAMATENAHLYSTTQRQLTQLQTLYEQVSALEQEKTDMIRLASHDLRDPIGTIMGYLDLMVMDQHLLNEDQRLYVEMMQRLASKSNRIVQDILSLERTRSGTSLEAFDLCHLVRDVMDDYRYSIAEKKLSFSMHTPDHEVIVMGDDSQLREAIANLVANAIKYTPEQGTVDVKLVKQGYKIVFEVADNGYGIPEALQEGLFQPFYRAVFDETKGIDGTGLGLHLVKSIVERHNGKLHYKSTYGEGSTFGFELPITQAHLNPALT